MHVSNAALVQHLASLAPYDQVLRQPPPGIGSVMSA